MSTGFYLPSYTGSHALVIGVNKYQHINPLAHASNDANAIVAALVGKFGFPAANVKLLTDGDATRSNIMREYLSFSDADRVSSNDRVLIFFAGHGHTVTVRREIGFLVPVDGNISDLSTLIRWDELTRDADLIQAKHILFLMDACYGGLAVTRKPIPPGSSRFLENMLTRLARQVVTAGKADETVSDGDGTRVGHSIFKSHLLDGLDGSAMTTPGIITAMGVMAYVYEKVGKDPNSNQTPHFGFIDGDGDFIFQMPARPETEKKGNDFLIKEPQYDLFEDTRPKPSIGEQAKLLIPDHTARIRLDDFVSSQLRETLVALSPEMFPSQGMPTDQIILTFAHNVASYEAEMRKIQALLIQLCRWADAEQIQHIRKVMETLAEHPERRGGFTVLTQLERYPLMCAAYAGGISALAAGRFDSLAACLLTEVRDGYSADGNPSARAVITPIGDAMSELTDSFKALPDMARRYTARSDHMLTTLQPVLEDELFLGRRYEDLFDRFEIMVALTFADLHSREGDRIWGPPGRFAWRENSYNRDGGPFTSFVENAKKQGQLWPALQAGFFGGSAARFAEVADGYRTLIQKLGWH